MDHAVLVYLRLSNHDFGSEAEREAIFALTDRMAASIETAGAGEFDGNEFGGGECTLFMYGPDADRLFAAVAPILGDSPLTVGGRAVKRYGSAANRHAKELQVSL